MQLLNHNRISEKSKVKVHLFIYRHIGIKHGLTPICLLQTNWALSFIMYSHFVIDKHRKRIKCSIYNCYWSCKIGMLCLWELCLLFVFHYYKMFSSYNMPKCSNISYISNKRSWLPCSENKCIDNNFCHVQNRFVDVIEREVEMAI